MRTHFNLMAVGFLLLLAGCGKDDEKLTQKCENFPDSKSDLGYEYVENKSARFGAPCFNPNNAQELCFAKSLSGPGTAYKNELWKVNLATGQQQKLLDSVQGQSDWGKNNWILFEFGSLAHMIKSDGDSLTHFVIGEYGHSPKWLSNSGLFLQNINDLRNRSTNLLERSPDGQIYKYLELKDPGMAKGFSYPAISPDGSKFVATAGINGKVGFYVFDYPSLKGEMLHQLEGAGYVIGRAWHPDNQHLFWTSGKGLFKTNVVTKQTWQLQTGCESRTYHFLSVSPDGQTLAVTKTYVKRLDEYTLESDGGIYLMDTNGKNERKLEL